MVFLPQLSGSASKSLRHPVTSPYERNPAGPLASAPGQTYPFIFFAHAHAHTRTHAQMRAHTAPSPPRACPRGFGAELALGPPGLRRPLGLWGRPPPDLQVTHSQGYLEGPSPGARLPAPRTLPSRVTTSLRPRDAAWRLRAARPVPRAWRWNPGPRERAHGRPR